MLSIEPLLKTRLQALTALTGWAVRVGSDQTDRRVVPAVDARCAGAAVTDSKAGAVLLQPQWVLTLAVRRGPDAAERVDAALAAVIGSLHNWQPGQAGGRGWEPLRLAAVTEPTLAEEGLAGYELTFTTAARYMGQQ
jgi:hypothetical protein